MELRELLAPRVSLNQPLRWGEENSDADDPKRLKDLVSWQLVLAADDARSLLVDVAQSEQWRAASVELLEVLQQLLVDALDLLRELGDGTDQFDRSYWDLPSISPHWQNRGFHDWVILIELLRDAWIATRQDDPARVRRIAQTWFSLPHPTFKRLALFAASYDDATRRGEWVNWLLADDSWWMWSVDTQREALRLLVLQGARLTDNARSRLETGILRGPPRRMFRDDIEPERWQDLLDQMMWLRLAKLVSGGSSLGRDATAKLSELSAAHPEWRLSQNERDEFSHWMSGTGDPDYENLQEIERAPRQRRLLVEWLQRPSSTDFFHSDDWRDVCREKFSTAACALCALARKSQWPVGRWGEALQVWSDEKLIRRSWRRLAPLVQRMPDRTLVDLAQSISWWLQAVSKVLDRNETAFLDLCRRVLEMAHQDDTANDRSLDRAINQPIGQITQALLNFWFHRKPEDGQGLADDLKPMFTLLCNTRSGRYAHARVLLAANVIAFFRVDSEWAADYLLPLFKWQNSAIEARAAWDGFLWSPRLYRPLLSVLKGDFLETARHYAELAGHPRQYAAILTYAALDRADTFTVAELNRATSALPPEALQETAQTLVHALEGAGEQRKEQWENRIQPYWRAIWPKSRLLASEAIANQLTRLAIAAGDGFPSAVATLRDWLQPLEHPYYVIQLLDKSGLCKRFPEDALVLLGAIIADQPWPSAELAKCLDDVAQAWPAAQQDNRYQQLLEYARRHA